MPCVAAPFSVPFVAILGAHTGLTKCPDLRALIGGGGGLEKGLESPPGAIFTHSGPLKSVLFKRPFSNFASTCEIGEGGMWEYMQPIPIFPTGVQVVQMDAETLELEKEWVGSSIGLKGEARTNWELQMSHNDVYFFSHREYNATGKWTRWKNLDVKGTEVKVLSDLVPMFSASGCTTLFVHACTTNVRFE